MAERGRHPERGDVYRDYKSRDGVYSRNGDHAPQDSRGLNQKPRDMDMRGSAGDKRAKHSRQRDIATASDVHPPAYRDHNHEGPPKQYGTSLYLLTAMSYLVDRFYILSHCCPGRSGEMSVYHSEGEYYEPQHRQALYNLRYLLTSRGKYVCVKCCNQSSGLSVCIIAARYSDGSQMYLTI